MSTSIIGLDFAYFAPLTNEATKSYGTMKKLDPVVSIDVEPENNSTSQYGDNRAVETINSTGGIKFKVVFTGLSVDNEGLLLGHKVSAGKLTKRADDIAPYGAFIYRRMKADGGFRYKVLYKGSFSRPKESTTTKKDSVEFSEPELEGTFMPLAIDGGLYEHMEDAPAGDTTIAEKWAKGIVFP